jgi:Flp pilus assembly protein TadD
MQILPLPADLDAPVRGTLEALARVDGETVHKLMTEIAGREGETPLVLHLAGLLALRLQQQGQALELFTRAHQAAPEVREFSETLAIVHSRLGRLVDSLYFEKLAIAATAEFGVSGLVPAWLGTFAEAFREIEERPLLRQAMVLSAQGAHEAAAQIFHKAAEVDRHDREAWRGLAVSLLQAGRPFDAVRASAALLSLGASPDDLGLHGETLAGTGVFDEADAHLLAAVAARPEDGALAFRHVRTLAHRPGDGAPVAAALLAWAERFGPPAPAPPCPPAPTDRRLTLGLVGSNWGDGEGLDLIIPTLAELPRGKVALIVYADGLVDAPLARRIRARADTWHDWSEVDSETAAMLVRNEAPDVLLDLDGPLRGRRPELFLARPVTRTLSLYGYPTTAEALGFAGVIGDIDPSSDPISGLISIEGGVASPPLGLAPMGPWAPRTGAAVFGTLANAAQIDGASLAIWREILEAAPGSTLLIDPRRVGGRDIVPRLGDALPVDRVRVYEGDPGGYWGEIDALLDSLDNPAPDATVIGACVGVPVITRWSPRPRAGLPATWLRSIGLGRFVAESDRAYLGVALALTDRAEIAAATVAFRDAIAADRADGAARRGAAFADAIAALVGTNP